MYVMYLAGWIVVPILWSFGKMYIVFCQKGGFRTSRGEPVEVPDSNAVIMNGVLVENYDWEYWGVAKFDRHLPCVLCYHGKMHKVPDMLTSPVVDSGGHDENRTQENQSSGTNWNVRSGGNEIFPGSGAGPMQGTENNENDGSEGGENGGGVMVQTMENKKMMRSHWMNSKNLLRRREI